MNPKADDVLRAPKEELNRTGTDGMNARPGKPSGSLCIAQQIHRNHIRHATEERPNDDADEAKGCTDGPHRRRGRDELIDRTLIGRGVRR
jgi:hypothetical protein